MNDVKSLQILEARVAKLERAARRWMAGCFAVCVLAVGMGAVANEALKEVEFESVKAKRFQVVGSDGKGLATFGMIKTTNRESTVLVLGASDDSRTTIMNAGGSPVPIVK